MPGTNIVVPIEAFANGDQAKQTFLAIFTALESKAASAGNVAGAAMDKVGRHAASSLDGVRLLSQEFGLRLPRALESMIARMPALSGAIQSVIGALAGIAIGEVIFKLGKGVFDLYEKWIDVDTVVSEYNRKLDEAVGKEWLNADSVETAKGNLEFLTAQLDQYDKRLDKARNKSSKDKFIDALTFGGDQTEKDIQTERFRVFGELPQAKKADIESRHSLTEKSLQAEKELISARLTGSALISALSRIEIAEAEEKLAKTRDLNALYNDQVRQFNALHPLDQRRERTDDAATTERDIQVATIRQKTAAQLAKESVEIEERMGKARVALQTAYAEQAAGVDKNTNHVALANLEALHAQLLISDREFYRQRLALQESDLSADDKVLAKRIDELQKLKEKQHKDKRLKRDKSGVSEEELQTEQEIIRLASKRSEIEAQRKTLQIQSDSEGKKAERNDELENLRQAAQLEQERNSGIQARLALLKFETDLKLKKTAVDEGVSSPEYRQIQDLEKVEEAKIRIVEVERQIRTVQEQERIAVENIKTAEAAHLITKLEAEKKIAVVEKQTAAEVAKLLPMYREQAALLGGEYLTHVKQIEAEIFKLNHPANDKDTITGMLREGFTEVGNSIVSTSLKGKNAFKDMANSILQDIDRMIAKMLQQLVIQKALNALFSKFGFGGSGGDDGVGDDSGTVSSTGGLDGGGFGEDGGFPGFAAGGHIEGPAIVGEQGPELFIPHTPGTIVNNSALGKLGAGSGKGENQRPNISLSVVNNSSQAVNPSSVGTSYDQSSKSYVIGIVLEDLATGGPIFSALPNKV